MNGESLLATFNITLHFLCHFLSDIQHIFQSFVTLNWYYFRTEINPPPYLDKKKTASVAFVHFYYYAKVRPDLPLHSLLYCAEISIQNAALQTRCKLLFRVFCVFESVLLWMTWNIFVVAYCFSVFFLVAYSVEGVLCVRKCITLNDLKFCCCCILCFGCFVVSYWGVYCTPTSYNFRIAVFGNF